MSKRVLIVFVVVFGLMVAGAGIFAFAAETDESPSAAADEPTVVLAQEEVEEPAEETGGMWGHFKGPHDMILDEVLDELVADGTIDEELAAEIRAAYEAKVAEKVAELPEDLDRFGRKFGSFFDKDGTFDLEKLPPWLEGLDLDEDLLGLFEGGLTPEELEELRGQLPEGFEFAPHGFRGSPFGQLDELGIDIESYLEDGQIAPEERDEIRKMIEEQFGEGFEFEFRGPRGRRGPAGPSDDDAEASFGFRIGGFDASV